MSIFSFWMVWARHVWMRFSLIFLADIDGRRLKETADDEFPVLESVWPTRAHIYPHNIQHGSQTCISVPFLARGSPALVWVGSKRVPMTSARDPALVSALTVGQTDRAAACVCWQSAGRLWWWLRFSVITAWSVRQTDRQSERDRWEWVTLRHPNGCVTLMSPCWNP